MVCASCEAILGLNCVAGSDWSKKFFKPMHIDFTFEALRDLAIFISKVPDQNGVSVLYIMLEIHHSGREPSIYSGFEFDTVCGTKLTKRRKNARN